MSFVSADGESWSDITLENRTVCLKVYTVEDNSQISSSDLTMNDGDGSYFEVGVVSWNGEAAGAGEDTYTIGKMIAIQIQGLLVAYKERFDKDNFIKSLLLDNLLLVDIYNRAKKLHIETDMRRVVYLIETRNEKELYYFFIIY